MNHATDVHTTFQASGRHPLTVEGSVELAVLSRSGMIESRHIGAGVVVDAEGRVLRSVGDPAASIYPRSCLKPLQALGVLRTGVDLKGTQAVLATASHAGTPTHQDVVRGMLARIGASEDDLLCPPDWPGDRSTSRATDAPHRLAMNCSGKHAAFLLACARGEWDPATYDDLDHPLQRVIRDTVEEFTGETIDHAGVDGCGAPVFAVSLRGLATGIGRVSGAAGHVASDSAGDPLAAHLVQSVLDDAWALDGVGRANTVTIDELGVFAKLGAEGVMVMGTLEGVAVAVKVLDGSLRAATATALHLLTGVGAVDGEAADAVIARTSESVLGAGKVVGGIRVTLDS